MIVIMIMIMCVIVIMGVCITTSSTLFSFIIIITISLFTQHISFYTSLMSSTTVKTSLLHHIRDNNSEETSKKAIKLLLQVVANIVKFPHEEKYRKLKEDKILPKIDNCHQFFDIIYRIGFIQLSTHIELPMTASLDPLADLVGEIEGKPAPQVPKMDSKKSGGCCETDSGQTGCCGGTKSSDKKKEWGMVWGW